MQKRTKIFTFVFAPVLWYSIFGKIDKNHFICHWTNLDKLTADEKKIYVILQFKALPSGKLVEYTGFGKTKVLQIVNKLVKSGFLRKQGLGRGTTYTVK